MTATDPLDHLALCVSLLALLISCLALNSAIRVADRNDNPPDL